MPKDVYVTFKDGSSHVYKGAPDDVTPDAIEARAMQEFNKPVASLSRAAPGVKLAAPAPQINEPPVKPAPVRNGWEEAGNAFKKALKSQYQIEGGAIIDPVHQLKTGIELVGDLTHAAGAGLGSAWYNLTGGKSLNGQGNAPIEVKTVNGRRVYRFNNDGPWQAVPMGADGKPDLQAIAKIKRPMVTERATQDTLGNAFADLATFALPGGGAKKAAAKVAEEAPAVANAFARDVAPDAETLYKRAEAARALGHHKVADVLVKNAREAEAAAVAAPSRLPAQPAPAQMAPAAAGRPSSAKIKAAKKVKDMLASANVAPEAAFADNGLLPVQNIGSSAEGVLKAAARRPGETGELLKTKVAEFNAAMPNKVAAVAERSAGVDRSHIAGDIQDIIAKAQKNAKPHYDAYAELGPMSSSEIERLLATPTGKTYLKGALKNALDSGADPHDIQVMTQMVDGLATDAGPKGNATDYLQQAEEYLGARHVSKALKKALGPSLSDYLAQSGGLADLGGDVAAMDGHIAHKGIPFKQKLVKPGGRGLDDAAVAAWEAGYFPNHKYPPEPAELLEKLRQEMAGNKSYAKSGGEAADLAARIENFDTQLARYGIDPTGKTAKQIASELAQEEATVKSLQDLADNGTASVMPETEMVEKAVPTPRALYDVKKFADQDYVKRAEAAQAKGASEPDDWAKDKWYGDFREALGNAVKGKGFDWENLLRAGGEAPKVKKAYTDGQRLIEGNDYRRLLDETKDMSTVEKKAAVGGLVKSALDAMAAKQRFDPSRLRLYASDDFAARIAYMTDSVERGKAWQAGFKDLQKQAEIRNLVGGSHTGDIAAGAEELAAMSGGAIDVKKIPKSKGELVGAGLDQVNKVIDRVHAGASAQQRNELGRMLVDPEYGRKALEELAAYRKEHGTLRRAVKAGKKVRRGIKAARPVARAAVGVNAAKDNNPNAFGQR